MVCHLHSNHVTVVFIFLFDHRKATEDLPQPFLRDYQIELDSDSMYIWDGTREAGAAAWSNGLIDSILLKDKK